MNKPIIHAGCLIIWLVLLTPFPATGEDMNLQPSHTLDFPYLTDPNTMAVSIQWEGTLKGYGGYLVESRQKQHRLDLRYSADGLFPFIYHPDGIFRADIDGAFNWVIEAGGVTAVFETGDASEASITQGKPYFGSLSIDGGLETGADSVTEKWMVRNYLLGVRLRQMIPGSDLDIFGKLLGQSRMSGNIPIVAEISFNRVFEANPGDSSFYRLDMVVDWGFQLIEQVYLYPHIELAQARDTEASTYFRGELAKYFRVGEQASSIFGVQTEFVFLVRYITGKRPPDYIHIDDWEIGFGLDWSGAL